MNRKRKKQLSLFDLTAAEASDYARVAITAHRRQKKKGWRGMIAVPPGSLLDTVISEFSNKTNIALEIPYSTFLHYVSGALLAAGSKITFQGSVIESDIWSIVLAESGGGKTWTQKKNWCRPC
jgi:hypothetical protein